MSRPPDPAVPPQYPEPSSPDAAVPPPPAYPAPPTTPPPYPAEPPYPAAAPQNPTPASNRLIAPPAYPTTTPSAAAAPPAYPTTTPPTATAPPAYPTAAPAGQPAAPASQPTAPPAQPTAASPYPAHPGAPPAYPTSPPTPPQQPPPPLHPAQGPIPAPGGPGPGWGPAQPPQYPATGHPPLPPQITAAPFQPQYAPQPAPDDLDYRHRGARLHVAEFQRGTDATAVAGLAVQAPGALVSLALVSSLALGMFGNVVGTLVILAWVASGLLVFHRPTERAFARHVLKLRPPTGAERARLEPIWNEVTARAGIEPGTYELMVENSGELNAVAVAGHVVGVTTYSLTRIPTSNLAAVLAHELGHHTGGHAWAGLLGYWYSLPGRIAWAVTRGLARFAIAVASVFSMAATGFLVLLMAMMAAAAFLTAWFIAIPLVLAPYLLAYTGRRGELRADQQAAELGFARQLAEVLHHFQAEEAATKAALVAQGQRLKEPGALARLLSSHPDHQTRLSALEPYLGLRR
ncbi:M48 family metalloprotease [Streptomyces sp. NPDC014889]|uniref:M48 family metalloprotease n=1 Tax=Streptomyces sp. NPDC014889 TaxID=3364928 RepID=UPI0036FA9326